MHVRTGNWTKLAIGLVLVMVILQAVNVVRVVADPVGFSEYMGLGLDQEEDASFVYVYGLRTAFIVIIVGALVYLRDYRMLCVVATAALVLPIGDAFLSLQAEASTAIVLRHTAIAFYLGSTAFVLSKAVRETNH